MHAQIVLREIASSAAQLIGLDECFSGVCHGGSRHQNAAADPRTIRLHTDQLDLDPVPVERGIAPQQLRDRVDAVHYDVDIAVVVVVAERTAASRRVLQDAWPTVLCDILKTSVL